MVINFIHTLFRVYYMLIFVRIILSWFPVNRNSEWVNIIEKLTDPYLNLFRKLIPPIGMVDISPIAAIIALNLIENLVIRIIFSLAL